MSNQAIVFTLYAVFVAACIVPALLSGTAMRRLKGWTRGLAVHALLIGLPAVPYIWLEPQLREAGRHGPDAGAFIGVGMQVLMTIALLSTLVGFAVGGVIIYHRQRKRAPDITTVL